MAYSFDQEYVSLYAFGTVTIIPLMPSDVATIPLGRLQIRVQV
jgi:hypothetical protein